jgi:alpha-tubulin suppressor-like RCC1 family protein
MIMKNRAFRKHKTGSVRTGGKIPLSVFLACYLLMIFLLPLSHLGSISAISPIAESDEQLPEGEPENLPEDLESFVELEYRKGMVSAGLHHTALLNEAGKVYCWGDNMYGQLGTGTLDHEDSPCEIKDLTDIMMVSAGAYHTVALSRYGDVYAWGRNTFGQVGNGKTETVLSPVRVDGIPPIRAISAGAFHTLALSMDGEIYAWGNNTNGQVGDVPGEEILDDSLNFLGTRVLMPAKITNGGGIAVSGGGSHSLYLDSQGIVYAWGDNTYGQLGDGSQIARTTPMPVEGLTQVIKISAGYLHNLAVRECTLKTMVTTQATSDESPQEELKFYQNLYVWGSDSLGQLGLGREFDTSRVVTIPTRVDVTGDSKGENDKISLIEAGYFHTIVTVPYTDRKGTKDNILIWGDNTYGQLGIGALPSQNKPVKLVGTSNGWTGENFLPFQSVAAGGYHTVFYSVKGFLGTVGRADKGQLGNVSVISKSVPIGIAMPDSIAPAWVSGEELNISVTEERVRLSWGDAKDNIRISTYLVTYINKTGEQITVDTGLVNEYEIADANVEIRQIITVKVVDEARNLCAIPLQYIHNEDLDAPEVETPENPEIVNPENKERLWWTPEAYGSIQKLEVPWDVDHIYGMGSILPPSDFSWIIAGAVTIFVILVFVFIGVSTFRRNHRKKAYYSVSETTDLLNDLSEADQEDEEPGEEIMRIGEGIEIIQTRENDESTEKRWFRRKNKNEE